MARTADDPPEPPVELPVLDAMPRPRADAQRNSEKVLTAAKELFRCNGVENVSMEAIATAAGVGKGTLFRRFGDRAGLARALLQEQTAAVQDAMIRGAPPLGPGAPPKERLKAMGRAQLALLGDQVELIAAGEAGRPAARYRTGPYTFLRMHASMLIQEADPEADWEILSDVLLAPLGAESYYYWSTLRGLEPERILAAYDALVDRMLP